MLKKILIAFAVVIAGFAAVIALQPAHFSVARTATISAPAESVFIHVNDLRKWDAWSPWAKIDPNAKVAFEGPAAGTGAAFTWSGNDEIGEGRMTVAESRPAELVKLNVEFVKPFAGSSRSEFTFKPEGQQQTAVTWTMSGEHGFFGKAMCLILNGQRMMGGEIEKGLANLKSVAEAGRG